MKRMTALVVTLAAVFSLWANIPVQAASDEVDRVMASMDVLNKIMVIPEDGIPPALLNSAFGIAVIPSVIKAGFILGGRYGKGVILVRNEGGGWSNPLFISIMGGSLGYQIGAQSTDVILVFKSARSIDAITGGKFTLGADASVAAGPVGRHAAASTDWKFSAEIYSYSRSRGLFAGVSLEGAALQVDYYANSAFYNMAGILPVQILKGTDLQAPPVANDLRQLLARYTH